MLALQQLPTPGRLPALTTLRPRGPHTACDAPLSARHAADARTAHDMRGAASLTAVSSMNTTALTLFCRNNTTFFLFSKFVNDQSPNSFVQSGCEARGAWCGVASARGRIACRVRSSRSQRGERWVPSRRGQLLQREHVGTPREGCSPCLHLYTRACACGANLVRGLP